MKFAQRKEDWEVFDPRNISREQLKLLLFICMSAKDFNYLERSGENHRRIDPSRFVFFVMRPSTPFRSDKGPGELIYSALSSEENNSYRVTYKQSFWIVNSGTTGFLPPFPNAYSASFCGADGEETSLEDEHDVFSENTFTPYPYQLSEFTGLLTNDQFIPSLFNSHDVDYWETVKNYGNKTPVDDPYVTKSWKETKEELDVVDGDFLYGAMDNTFSHSICRVESIIFPKFLPCLLHPRAAESAMLIQRWWREKKSRRSVSS